MTEKQLEDIFTFHSPDEAQRAAYEKINASFLQTAKIVNEEMPNGPGHTVAIRKLNEARNAANTAVALRGTF